jgi:hypothetical protein
MPRVCTVCSHPQRSEIDECLVSGQSNRGIAKRFGVDDAAVFRHRNAHLPAQVAMAREAREVARADDLLAGVVALRKRLQAALDAAQAAKDVASLSRELRETLRLMLELEGRLRHGAQVQVALSVGQSPEWLSLLARITRALGPYPEARQAVLAAVETEAAS